jgi:hypothetical protein
VIAKITLEIIDLKSFKGIAIEPLKSYSRRLGKSSVPCPATLKSALAHRIWTRLPFCREKRISVSGSARTMSCSLRA